jgi:hypothetical protein
LFFQAVSRTGKTVDSGAIARQSSTSGGQELQTAAAGAGR